MAKAETSAVRRAKDVRSRLFRDRPSLARLWSDTRPKRDIAVTLVGLRKRANLTQQELAERIGWDKSFVSRLESAAGGVPDLATIAHYAEACNAVAGVVFASLENDHLLISGSVGLSKTEGFSHLVGVRFEHDDPVPEEPKKETRAVRMTA